MTHGVSGYRHGCRCEECRAAVRVAHKKWRDKVAGGPIPDKVHGTGNGYKVYGCRCDECRGFQATYSRSLRARKKTMWVNVKQGGWGQDV